MQPIDFIGGGVVAVLAIVALVAFYRLPEPEPAPRRPQAAAAAELPAQAAAARPLTFGRILGAVVLGNLITGFAAVLLYLLITAK